MKRNEKEIILNEEFAGKLPGESFITSCAIASSLVRRGVGSYKSEEDAIAEEKEVKPINPPKLKKSHK